MQFTCNWLSLNEVAPREECTDEQADTVQPCLQEASAGVLLTLSVIVQAIMNNKSVMVALFRQHCCEVPFMSMQMRSLFEIC